MALIGLGTGNPEAAQGAAFPLMALVVLASNAFVPTSTMPGPLRAYANHQPVSATVPHKATTFADRRGSMSVVSKRLHRNHV